MNELQKTKAEEKVSSLKKESIQIVDEFLKTFSAHFAYNQDDIYASLLERPERYVDLFCKLAGTVLSAHKSEDKVNININNNSYVAFFERIGELRKQIDNKTHTLVKNGGNYEMVSGSKA